MKLIIDNFLFVYHTLFRYQNNVTAQSLTELVHLYHYAEDQIKEIQSMVQTLMESFAVQQKKIIGEWYNKCSNYVSTGLKRVTQSSEIDSTENRNKINDCFLVVNATIDATVEEYLKLYDRSEEMLALTIEKLQKEPAGDDLDEINDEIDDIIDEFKESLDAEINTPVESLLRRMRTESVSLPLLVKKCIDEVLNNK